MFNLPLPGLSARNLVSHLALLGVMKILEEDAPDWQARGYWEKRGADWSPVLALAVEKTGDDLCKVLAQGLSKRAGIFCKAFKLLSEVLNEEKTEVDLCDALAQALNARKRTKVVLKALELMSESLSEEKEGTDLHDALAKVSNKNKQVIIIIRKLFESLSATLSKQERVDNYLSMSESLSKASDKKDRVAVCRKAFQSLSGTLNKEKRVAIYREALKSLEELQSLPEVDLIKISSSAFADAVRKLSIDAIPETQFICALSAGLEKEKKLSFSPLLLLEGDNKKTTTLASKKGYGYRQWTDLKNSAGKINDTLFGDGFWTRSDDILKFYWDYGEWVEQEREGRDTGAYPHNKNHVEWAASALAQVGFSGLGALPALVDGKLQTKAPGWVNKGLLFPLWTTPAAYDVIQELLLSKMLSGGNRRQLEQIGVKKVVNIEVFFGAKGRKATRYGNFLY